jgi:hypothetical protein
MSRNVLTGFACAFAIAAPLAAQEPQPTSPQTGTPPSQTAAATAAVSIEGCLMRELDVPGRRVTDEMRSRTNTDNDFVLIDAKPAQNARATSAAPRESPQPDTPVGTSGSVSTSPVMYKVKNVDAAQLEEHKNQRVRIQGTLDRTDRTNNPDTYAGDLVLLRGSAVEKIEGTCPAPSNEKR